MFRDTEKKKITENYNKGLPSLLTVTISADLLTPVAVLLNIRSTSPYHFLYESVEGGKSRSRYSIIGFDPDIIWRCRDGKVDINRHPKKNNEFMPLPEHPFTSLRALIKESQLDIAAPLPPMLSGLFGYMGFDVVRLMEDLPMPEGKVDPLDIPDSIFIRPKMIIVFDSVKDEAILATPIWVDSSISADVAYKNAEKRIADTAAMLAIQQPIPPITREMEPITLCSHIDLPEYAEMVIKAGDYIKAGDIFQVVPSRRLSGEFTLDPFAFYRALRQLNPSPYLFYIAMDGFVITGSSPEILVRLRDGKVTIRPIAGTRKRGKDAAEDKNLAAELLADPKDLAEHLMLLDLGRNDVGRVAKPGTVKVTEKMVVEYYSHVMHIVSNVEGEIRDGADAIDALIAGFPAGTVSGAPKIRAMEIIDELEKEKRSFYGGCVGYFSANGSMDTCIALRTALIKDNILTLQAGGGVVADSNPRDEFIETENKAAALKRAAEWAAKFVSMGNSN